MKYIDADKMNAEIERLLARANRRTDKEHLSHNSEMEKFGEDYWNGYGDLAYSLLGFITSLQQEQPSLPSNLDEAAFEYENTLWEEGYKDCGYSPQEVLDAFKAGAEWMAGQMNQEQSEVDLEEEVKKYFQGLWPGTETAEQCNTHMHFTPPAILRMVDYFYELGKNARKQ